MLSKMITISNNILYIGYALYQGLIYTDYMLFSFADREPHIGHWQLSKF